MYLMAVLATFPTQFQGHVSIYHVAQIAFNPTASATSQLIAPPVTHENRSTDIDAQPVTGLF